jgi:type VI protein secretion system component VasK
VSTWSEGTVTRIKRTIVACGAWAGWGGAAAVTAVAPFVEVADEHPFFVQRVFALCAMVALLLSVVWLIDRARRPEIPVPARTAYDLGVEFGKNLGRMEAELARWNAPNRRLNPMVGEIMDRRESPVRWRL